MTENELDNLIYSIFQFDKNEITHILKLNFKMANFIL